MFTRIFLIISLLFTGSLLATVDYDRPLEIAELIDLALENHPSTKQAWWNAHRAAAALGASKSAYYPDIGIQANIKNGRDFQFINGPDTSYTYADAELAASFLLFDFGQRSSTVKAAKMALLASNWQMNWEMQKVIIRVLENVYATLHAQEVVQASQSSLDDAEKVFKDAKELSRIGINPISDVCMSQANLSQMKMDLSEQKALLDIQKAKLATSLGLPATVNIQLADVRELSAPCLEKIDTLIQLALRQRADLMGKQARLCESFAVKDIAKSQYGPKITAFGSSGAGHYFHDRTNSAQYEIGINLDMPLFSGFSTMYENRIAYADSRITMEEMAELQLDIILEVITYSRTLQAAQEMLPEAELILKSCKSAYEGVLSKYNAGKDSMTDVSIAQRELASARIQYSDVRTQWLLAIANLAYATGTLAPYMEEECEANP